MFAFFVCLLGNPFVSLLLLLMQSDHDGFEVQFVVNQTGELAGVLFAHNSHSFGDVELLLYGL